MPTTDLDKLILKLKKCEIPTEMEVNDLCEKAKKLLANESNIRSVSLPVVICGDIHGQFYDLLELFRIGNYVPETNYIFLGDYVDRGRNSIETFLFLLALKVRYPDQVTLIRGNHESRQVSKVYGFYDECLSKYGSINVWKYCTDTFDYLCIAALIEGTYFCIHGGLSPDFKEMNELYKINRFKEIPKDGIFCDIMWSDPWGENGWKKSPRGAGYVFGKEQVDQFCYINNIKFITRAHQLVMDGYKWWFDKKLVTIWSAPNYCYRCGNIASIMEIDENDEYNFKCFGSSSFSKNKQTNFRKIKRPPPSYFS